MEYRSIGQMTNEEIKKLKRKELVNRLCNSNFSFEEKEKIFLSNRGQKCRSCGLLRINKKLSPYSFSDLHQKLICVEHHNEPTKKKQSLNNNQDEAFILNNNIIGPNMNQNPINNEILEDRPNIQIPIDDSEQILIDEPEDSNHSAINRNGNGINNYIEEEENDDEEESQNEENKYVTWDKFNDAMSANDKRFKKVEERLQNVEVTLGNVKTGLVDVQKDLGDVRKDLGDVQKGLGDVRKDLGCCDRSRKT